MELTDRDSKIRVLEAITAGDLLPDDLKPPAVSGMWVEEQAGIFHNGKGDIMTAEQMKAEETQGKGRDQRLFNVFGFLGIKTVTGMIVTGCTDPAQIEQTRKEQEAREERLRQQQPANEATGGIEPIPEPEPITEDTTAEITTEQQPKTVKPVKPVVFNLRGEIIDQEEKNRERAARMNQWRDINDTL